MTAPIRVSLLGQEELEADVEVVIVSPSERAFLWRGSVTDLVTDIAAVLTDEQLVELAGEAAIAWRNRKGRKA